MPAPLSLTRTSTTPLANQVAGHQGVMSDASGSLVIKPSLPREIAFYQTLNSATRDDPIRRLKPFVPQFFGTLRLEGQLQSSGQVERLEGKDEVPESVVLQNLSYAYTHPNILDVKLGTVLYGPDATDEKKARMDKQARETTTHETGVRLTGFQTWRAPTSSYILTPKSFGKSISVQQLPTGMVRFFPLPSDDIVSLVTPLSPAPTSATSTESEQVLATIPSSAESIPPVPLTPLSGTRLPDSGSYTSHATSPSLLIKVIDIILSELEGLISLLQTLEIRFVGGSVLIVYEGDPERLAAAVERYESKRAIKALKAAHPESPGEAGQRSAFSDDGSASSDNDIEDSDSDEDDDDVSLDGTREDAKQSKRCPPVTVKMIDFAHTWLVEGEGPDQGVLKGFYTLKSLLEGRKSELEAVPVAPTV